MGQNWHLPPEPEAELAQKVAGVAEPVAEEGVVAVVEAAEVLGSGGAAVAGEVAGAKEGPGVVAEAARLGWAAVGVGEGEKDAGAGDVVGAAAGAADGADGPEQACPALVEDH